MSIMRIMCVFICVLCAYYVRMMCKFAYVCMCVCAYLRAVLIPAPLSTCMTASRPHLDVMGLIGILDIDIEEVGLNKV
jgi:hypothetical protein